MQQFHHRPLIRLIDHPTHQLSISSIPVPTSKNLPISQLHLKINPSLIMQDCLKALKLMKRLKLLITVNLLMSSILSRSICQLLGKISSSSHIRELMKILSQGRHLKGQVSNNLLGHSLNTSNQSMKPPIHPHTSPNNIPTKTNPLSRWDRLQFSSKSPNSVKTKQISLRLLNQLSLSSLNKVSKLLRIRFLSHQQRMVDWRTSRAS